MRKIFGLVFVSGLLLAPATAARAQVAPGGGVVIDDGQNLYPGLPPTTYAAEMLPESLSHPWVIVPRYSTAATSAAGISYGNRFSPYGVYSRHAYFSTGPYPAVLRPCARFERNHWQEKGW